MIPLSLDQVAEVVAGEVADPGDAARVVDAVTIDSRTAGPGALFVPLAGEHVDGHDFVGDAVARGAAGYLLEAGRPLPGEPGAVVVDEPADALLGLGAWVRETVDPLVVAITGSQGKTTTKDLTAVAVAAGRQVVAAPGSYNNELGVPLTCCLLESRSEVLVTEVGARGVGHIARLCPILRPDIGVVTAVGPSHLEMLGDVDTVARAKSELVRGLDGGVAVLNADDERVAAMAVHAHGRVVTYGLGDGADWRASDLSLDRLARPTFTVHGPDGQRAEVRLGMPGEHNVGNSLAALAAADLCGVPLAAAAAGLSSARLSPWRMELTERDDGIVILNDAYNANPSSMRAALRTLTTMAVPGRRWAVLGHMAELGPTSDDEHAGVGRLCADLALDGLVVVGQEASAILSAAREAGFAGDGGLLAAATPAEAAELVRARVEPGDAVLVKASRAAGLETVAAALTGAGGGPTR